MTALHSISTICLKVIFRSVRAVVKPLLLNLLFMSLFSSIFLSLYFWKTCFIILLKTVPICKLHFDIRNSFRGDNITTPPLLIINFGFFFPSIIVAYNFPSFYMYTRQTKCKIRQIWTIKWFDIVLSSQSTSNLKKKIDMQVV